MRKTWSKSEEEFLAENYVAEGAAYCAKYLQLSIDSIYRKANRLELTKNIVDIDSYQCKLDALNKNIYCISGFTKCSNTALHRCKICDTEWEVKPNTLIWSQGVCPSCCKSYTLDKNQPALFYYISLEYDEIEYYKIGITGRSILDRFGFEFNKFNMKILKQIQFPTGKEAEEFEQNLLKLYLPYRANINILKSGNTEILTVKVQEFSS